MKNPVWIVGASKMSEDYFKVLVALKKPFEIIVRKKNQLYLFISIRDII
jgi:hypothetical protein